MQITYRFSFPHPASHLARVRMEIRGYQGEFVDLVLPSWVPGSYKIRDFARHVQEFSAGRHKWKKQAKNRWRILSCGAADVDVEYAVFCFELSVQTSHVDAEHAHLNPGSVAMYVDGRKEAPAAVVIDAPRGWRIATGLEPVRGARGTFRAADYDALVDCPIEVGTFEERTFRVRGVLHRVAWHGGGNHDLKRVLRDMPRICEAEVRMMRDIPYAHYTFLVHTAPDRGGGLEHKNSTSLLYPAFHFQPPDKYDNWLELVAHEFFHLWNVKRIRPEMLGPFDYEKEVYTSLLWVMEGLTSYYDALFIARSKVTPVERYLKRLAERMQKFEEKPGRLRQSLSESSFDTWTKLYQPNENAVNSMMSYYEKGELVGLCLDMEIRRATRNRGSLDDVMRLLYREYGRKDRGFPEDEFRRAVERVAGRSFARFFEDHIDGTAEIDWNRFLDLAGLRLFKEPKKENDKPKRTRTWLGVQAQKKDGRVTVTAVIEGSPSWRDGLSAKDEILAMDGWRIEPDDWEKRVAERRPGERLEVTVVREGRLRVVPVKLGEQANEEYKIKPVKKPTEFQRKVYESWIWSRWKKA